MFLFFLLFIFIIIYWERHTATIKNFNAISYPHANKRDTNTQKHTLHSPLPIPTLLHPTPSAQSPVPTPLYSLPIPYSPLPDTHSLFPIPHSPILTPHSPLPITQAKRKMYLPSSVSCDKNVKIFFVKCIWIVPALWIRIRSIWDLYSVAFWIQIHIRIPDPHIYKFTIQQFNWVNISLGDILFLKNILF